MQTAYLYDKQTKEYKSEVNAQLDPLESEKAGQDIYLLPANATWLKPTPKDGYASVWKGESWDMLEDHRKQEYWLPGDKYGAPAREMKELGALPEGAKLTAPERTLDEAKPAKIVAFKAERDAEEVQPVEYKGNLYDYDDKSRDRINAAIIALDAQGEGANIAWTLADNSSVNVTANDLRMVIANVAIRSNDLHVKYRTLKEKILACKTVAELEKIVW